MFAEIKIRFANTYRNWPCGHNNVKKNTIKYLPKDKSLVLDD